MTQSVKNRKTGGAAFLQGLYDFCSHCGRALFFAALSAAPLFAQEGERLPEAEVKAEKETAEHITREQMDERGDSDLWEAMRWIPGVTQSGGGQRDESAFTLRGSDATGVPVYVDGVPWIDPSRGQIDYTRFLTGDLESIDINKGYTSMLLGANNLGGAVIMRLAKPKKPFEAALKTSWDFDGGGYAGNLQSFSAGTRLNLFYAKATFQWRDVDHWRLPESFIAHSDDEPGETPGNNGNPQDSGNRLWSGSRDLKISAIFGVTPFEPLDIWVTYSYSDADKGFNPPAVAGRINIGGVDQANYRVWEWPYLRRHTATVNSALKTDTLQANLMGYFDKFDNRLNTYPVFGGNPGCGNNAWNAYLNNVYRVSDYDDWTAGLNLDGAYSFLEIHKISAAFQWRRTDHQVFSGKINNENPEHKDKYRDEHENEDIFFAGLEYAIDPFKPLNAVIGFGLDIFSPNELWKKNSNGSITDTVTDNLFIPQWSAALFYDLSEKHELHISYAKKNRFPTIFERTSATNTGTNKPNLGLKPVESHNLEFGYKGFFLERININTSVYYNFVYNLITQIQINDPPYNTMRDNVNKTAFYGFEGAMELYLNDYFSVGGAFGTQFYELAHSEEKYVVLGNMPELSCNAYMVIMPFAGIDTKFFENIKIIPRFEYVGSRYNSSYVKDAEKVLLPSYVLTHIKLSCDITKYAALSFAINNIFDELYELQQYFPQAGRSFNLTLEAKY
ncbi:MAG: TonB-dependent receptor [Spirochaetaceae bacterium]|jgi:iron complex outermembrane receptor protein|nr:TonB-dependent receptor [Spirochaetaceae bacterium]